MSILGEITTGTASVLRILEITYQLVAVDEQTTTLLRLTQDVESDIKHAWGLLRNNSNPHQQWMEAKIVAAETSVKEVAKLIEPCRVDLSTKQSINLKHRVLWVFRDSSDVQDKFRFLTISHQALTGIITTLTTQEMMGALPAALAKTVNQPPPYDPEMNELYLRREIRRVKSRSAHRTPSPGEQKLPRHASSPAAHLSPLVCQRPETSRTDSNVSAPARLETFDALREHVPGYYPDHDGTAGNFGQATGLGRKNGSRRMRTAWLETHASYD